MIKKPLSKNGKKNIMEELRNKLLDWAKQFETPDFIKDGYPRSLYGEAGK